VFLNEKPEHIFSLSVVEEKKIVASIADASIRTNVSSVYKFHTWNFICVTGRQEQEY
jgi:hypothetical protein